MNARTITRAPRIDAASRTGHHGASPATARVAARLARVEPTYDQLSPGDCSVKARVAFTRSFPFRVTTSAVCWRRREEGARFACEIVTLVVMAQGPMRGECIAHAHRLG